MENRLCSMGTGPTIISFENESNHNHPPPWGTMEINFSKMLWKSSSDTTKQAFFIKKNSFSVQFIEKKEFPTVRIILSWCTNHEYFSENKWTCGLKFNVNLSSGRTVSGKQKFQSYSTA